MLMFLLLTHELQTTTVCPGIPHWSGNVTCKSASDSVAKEGTGACDSGYALVNGRCQSMWSHYAVL